MNSQIRSDVASQRRIYDIEFQRPDTLNVYPNFVVRLVKCAQGLQHLDSSRLQICKVGVTRGALVPKQRNFSGKAAKEACFRAGIRPGSDDRDTPIRRFITVADGTKSYRPG